MKLPLLAMLILDALPLAAAPAKDISIVAAADAFDRAQLTKDGAAIGRIVLDDLVFIDSSGKRLGKKEFITGWTAPGDRFDPISLIDRTVVPLGRDAAVVGAEVNLCGTSDGVPFCSRIRYADTFVRIDGRWRVAHIQVTRIKG
ncbi:nuclear transport factor 2 family protein [Sphingomonas sp. G124]|uniref:Nuclear transport factor 2 family protein n=1 Tax=Sphingomonas cremea TaxID=2904799 RepID=A0A9X1QLV0_9SPHN|nr:nuclear transport factor 2 family protein [Sphingomonas cremea]MCF2515076.1 nuclear transport factor 2 family protein [Sphingomonas cremea]